LNFRLLPFERAEGDALMAADEAMLEALRQGVSPPSLRFYAWARPTLSLGFHQNVFPEHWRALPKVRRPTGGRAVWHEGDLTYAVAVRGLSGSTGQTYARLCAFLVRGLANLGIEVGFGRGGREYVRRPGCFSSTTSADLLWRGRKLVGSAQVRRGDTVLQHGAILLAPNRERLARLFPEQAPEAVVGLAEIQPDLIVDTVIASLTAAWAAEWQTAVVSGEWSEWERQWLAQGRARWRCG
jgi:lipoate-protein ligase A